MLPLYFGLLFVSAFGDFGTCDDCVDETDAPYGDVLHMLQHRSQRTDHWGAIYTVLSLKVFGSWITSSCNYNYIVLLHTCFFLYHVVWFRQVHPETYAFPWRDSFALNDTTNRWPRIYFGSPRKKALLYLPLPFHLKLCFCLFWKRIRREIRHLCWCKGIYVQVQSLKVAIFVYTT